jgi:hypothetical protein
METAAAFFIAHLDREAITHAVIAKRLFTGEAKSDLSRGRANFVAGLSRWRKQSNSSSVFRLFDHVIRTLQQPDRQRKADLFCRLKANDEFKLRRLLYWQISRLRSLEDLVDVVGGFAVQVFVVRPVEHEPALVNKLLLEVNGW